jgi:hypothetical protein
MGKARNLSKLSSALASDGAIPAAKGGTGTTTGGSGVTVYATVAALPVSGLVAGAQAYVTANNRLYLWTGTGWYNIALVNQAPTITSGANATYALSADGTPTVITLQGTDPEGFALTWSYQITTGSLGSTATITQNANVFTITPSTNIAHAGTFGITFRATDGINISTSISTVTLAFIGARYANLGSSSSVANVGTGVGISSVTNLNTSKTILTDVYGSSYPMYFTDAAPPVIATTLNGTITVEWWCKLQGTSYWKNLSIIQSSGDTSAYKRGLWTISDTQFGTKDGNSYGSPGTGNFIGTWMHIAMCCNATSCRYYRDGSLIGTAAAIPAGTISVELGTHPGYYSDIKVHAEFLYPANFSPPGRTLV